MINSILIFLDSGILIFEKKYDYIELNCELIASFISAIDKFGLQFFPDEELEDITFTDHHVFLAQSRISRYNVSVAIIHDKEEKQHVFIKELVGHLFETLKSGYVEAFRRKAICNTNTFKNLDEEINIFFHSRHRMEHSGRITCIG